MERIYRSILDHVSKVYDKQQSKADSLNLQRRRRTGEGSLGPTKEQTRFFQICNTLSDQLRVLGERMAKSQQLTDKGEMKNYSNIVLDAARNVQIFRKRKILNLKANKPVIRLCEQTHELAPKLEGCLTALEKGSGFCCGGGDQKKNFRNMMIGFRQYAANWRLLSEVEPKQMSESFIAQPFNEAEFVAIRDILSRNWPQGNRVIEREKIVEVKVPVEVVKQKQVVKYVDNYKPSRLSFANELIYGINREMNPCVGIDIYIQEADRNNNPDACNMLGQVYELGQLLTKDPRKAMDYYKKSNDMKNPYGTYLYARGFERGLLRQDSRATKQDLTMALKLYSLSAEANCPDACIQLADIYERGHFDAPNQEATVNRDLKKAYYYYSRARDLGSPKALNNLAVMYLKNKTMDESNPNNNINTDTNVQKNQRTAISLLEEAVAAGFPMAFYNLGALYEKGEGVNKNIDQAKELFYDGATKGCNKCKISYAFHLMDQTAIFRQSFEDEYRVAIRWLEEVIAQSDREEDLAKAFYYLGLYYEYGFGVDQKSKKAVQMFERSAYLMYPPAMNKLGHCYYSGFGVNIDRKIAIGYYKQAAEQGNDEALVNLGTAYYCGIEGILEKNLHSAYDYFEKAMKAGNTDAYVHLSQMYQKGIVVSKDEKLAHQLLVMGALKKNQNAIYMLQERGEPIQADLVANFDYELLAQPRPIDQGQVIPYIKDLPKALSSKYVSKRGA